MFFIAQRFGVTLQALINANPHIADPNLIFPGDVLCVPGAEPVPDCRIPKRCPRGFRDRYTVKPGDTMFLIAQRFDVSLQALIAANPHIADPNLIFPCDVLCVPDNDVDDDKLTFPCCVVLEPTFRPRRGSDPLGVALVQSLDRDSFRVGILAFDLDDDRKDDRKDDHDHDRDGGDKWDRGHDYPDHDRDRRNNFEGVIMIPRKREITFPLFRCPEDSDLWAGDVEFDKELTRDTKIAVRDIKKDKILLKGSLRDCGCAGD